MTDAKRKANAKYNKKMLENGINRQISITVKTEDYNIIDEYTKNNAPSKTKFIIAACKYCIDNNINLEYK